MANTFKVVNFVQKYEVSRKDIGLVFKWSNTEIYNLSLSLQVAYVGTKVMFSKIKDDAIEKLFTAIIEQKNKTQEDILQEDILQLITTMLHLAENARTKLKDHFKFEHPVLKDEFNNISHSDYIHASKELWRVKTIHLKVITLAAMECFIKGMEHAESTLRDNNNASVGSVGSGQLERYVDTLRQQIVTVVKESLFTAFNDLNVNQTTQDSLEELIGLFMDSIEGIYHEARCCM